MNELNQKALHHFTNYWTICKPLLRMYNFTEEDIEDLHVHFQKSFVFAYMCGQDDLEDTEFKSEEELVPEFHFTIYKDCVIKQVETEDK